MPSSGTITNALQNLSNSTCLAVVELGENLNRDTKAAIPSFVWSFPYRIPEIKTKTTPTIFYDYVYVVPMQNRGPSPNGKNVQGTCNCPSLNLSGSNLIGSGKYSGSRCSPKTGIKTGVPFSITTSVLGTLYGLTHIRLKNPKTGYKRNVSKINS